MARVQITLPVRKVFIAELLVRVSDINYGGHVGNDSILTLMHDARLIYYRSIGFKNEISFDATVGQIVTDAAVQYKGEAFLGDTLSVNIYIDEITKFGFDMFYQMINKDSGKEIAIGKTGIVCFDYEKRKVAPIPQILLSKIS